MSELPQTSYSPLQGVKAAELEDEISWLMLDGLHKHLNDETRPMGWSDLSEEQIARVVTTARSVIKRLSNEALTAENVSLKALLKDALPFVREFKDVSQTNGAIIVADMARVCEARLAAALNGTPQPSLREQALTDFVSRLANCPEEQYLWADWKTVVGEALALLKTEGGKS
jgi:hypothetical protein